jgi:hypothetical protein
VSVSRYTPLNRLRPHQILTILREAESSKGAAWHRSRFGPRHFRLGVFGALKSWNPSNLEPDKNPAFNNRLVVVKKPPFAANQWTHVASTHQGLGTPKGQASLYLNGVLIGAAPAITEPFAWDPAKTTLRLGVNYVGFLDDLMIFNRPLSPAEIKSLSR